MSNLPISGLPLASSISATDLSVMVQGGVTKKNTFQTLSTFINSQLPTIDTIYSNDGTVSANRTVSLLDKSLTFNGNAGSSLIIDTQTAFINSDTLDIGASITNIASSDLNLTDTIFVGHGIQTLGVDNTGKVIPVIDSNINIYNSNGSLNSNRIVNLIGQTLSFSGTAGSEITLGSENTTISSTAINFTASQFVGGGTQTLGVDNTGKVIPVIDSNINIYNSNGTLTGNRLVSLSTNSLSFNGLVGSLFEIGVSSLELSGNNLSISNTLVDIASNNVQFTSTIGTVSIKSPAISLLSPSFVGGGTQSLGVDNTGKVVTIVGTGDNIYNINGALTGNRVVDTLGYQMDFTGTTGSSFKIDTESVFIVPSILTLGLGTTNIASPIINLNSPAFIGAGTQHLAVDNTGKIIPVIDQNTNIYNTDGTLTGNRTVTMDSTLLTFTGGGTALFGVGTFQISLFTSIGGSITLNSDTIKLLPFAGGGVQSLGVDNTGKLISIGGLADNIYTIDGTLTSNRTVSLVDKNLSFSGTTGSTVTFDTNQVSVISTTFSIGSANTTISSPDLKLTDSIFVGGGTQTLGVDNTGKVIPVLDANNNIYNSNGTLTSTRTLTLNGFNLNLGVGNLTLNSNNSSNFKEYLSITGTFNSGVSRGNPGAGSQAFFYPQKAAFRAGLTTSSQWDEANVGFYSTAFGLDCVASGTGSFSCGDGNTAGGPTSSCFGGTTNVSQGTFSSILGGSGNFIASSATNSVAIGTNVSISHLDVIAINTGAIVPFTSANPDTIIMRASNGIGLQTNDPKSQVEIGSLSFGIKSSSTATNTSTSTQNTPIILIDATAGARTVDLASSTLVANRIYSIIRTNTNGNNVTVTTQGAETINGDPTFVLNNTITAVEVISDGSNWFIKSTARP